MPKEIKTHPVQRDNMTDKPTELGPPFDADAITIDNWQPMFTVRDKVSACDHTVYHATPLYFPEGFVIKSKTVFNDPIFNLGCPGDWLFIGPDGTKHIVSREEFEEVYEYEQRGI
jgi:hypothetical protein